MQCHIARAHSIFGDRAKAIELCINRFDEDTKVAFNDLYLKLDGTLDTAVQEITDELNQAIENY